MARIRTIKPEFWTDEKIVSLSPLARLLFIGMWNFVDDEGRAEFSPLRLKMQILPADPADVSELIGEIRREKLIDIYEVEGKQYFAVVNFAKHQKSDKRWPSKLPPPPASSPNLADSRPRNGMEREEEREEERKKDGGAGAPTANGQYAFEGSVVRLTEKDLATWRQTYHAITDIEAEIRAADAYYRDHPPKDGKWFFHVSNWLKRTHTKALEANKPRAGPADMYVDPRL